MQKYSSFFTTLVVSLFVIVTFITCSKNSSSDKPLKYVAYVGRYTDMNAEKQPDNRFDRMHEYMLKHYLAKLNETNITVNLEVKKYDCKRDPKEAAEVYKQIASDSNVIAVVDNTWGVHLEGAREVIEKNKIPVIAINADHNFANFGDQVVFTGNNDYLPNEIISFAKKVLFKKDVIFISEEDYSLHNSFLSEFEKNNITVKKMFTIKNKAEDKVSAFDFHF